MFCLRNLLILLLPLLPGIVCDDDYPHFACTMTGDLCTMTQVVVNRTHPHFQPTANDVNAVRRVVIHSSTIPFLVDDICKTFPRIVNLKITTSNIEEIDDDAFVPCASLEEINLEQNQLKKITNKTFVGNSNLTVLNLGDNRLEELPQVKFIYADAIKELYLHNNKLKHLPVHHLQDTPLLEVLYIHTNDFLDLDEDAILRILPKLSEIAYNHNEMSCVRVQKINAAFRAAGVKIATVSVKRERYYPQEQVDNVICSPDISWKAVHYRKIFNQSNDNKRVAKTRDQLELLKPEIDEVKNILTNILNAL